MSKYLKPFLVLAFCFFNAASALGCVCDTTTFPEEFNRSAAIFIGRYIGEEYRKGIVSEMTDVALNAREEKKDYEVLVLKFQVENWWKGNLKQEVILVTDQVRFANGSSMISDCGLGFDKNERYLIYAFGEADRLQTSVCSRTNILKKAKSDLKLLGKGRKPSA